MRREAFVDAGLRLMQAKGFEQMSIQDLLDELGASRGAFYHYFDSKQALLEAMVERIVDAAMQVVEEMAADTGLPAVPKLEAVFSTIGRWKTERKSLMLAFIKVWMSDHNAIVREKVRRVTVARFAPLLTRIIEQGVTEGAFAVASPAETAQVLVLMFQGFQEGATEMFLGRQTGAVPLEVVERTFKTYAEAFERVLGVHEGAIHFVNEEVLREWFG